VVLLRVVLEARLSLLEDLLRWGLLPAGVVPSRCVVVSRRVVMVLAARSSCEAETLALLRGRPAQAASSLCPVGTRVEAPRPVRSSSRADKPEPPAPLPEALCR